MSIITKQIKFYATVATRDRALKAQQVTKQFLSATAEQQGKMETDLLETTFTAKLPNIPDVINPETINEFFIDAGKCFNSDAKVLMHNCIRWLVVKHRDTFARGLIGNVTKAMQEQFVLIASEEQLAKWRKAKQAENEPLANQIMLDTVNQGQ